MLYTVGFADDGSFHQVVQHVDDIATWKCGWTVERGYGIQSVSGRHQAATRVILISTVTALYLYGTLTSLLTEDELVS